LDLPTANPALASHCSGKISSPVQNIVLLLSTVMRPTTGHLLDFFVLLVFK
jgi:hypothetical protein